MEAPEEMFREMIAPCFEYPTGGAFYHEVKRKTYRGEVIGYVRKDLVTKLENRIIELEDILLKKYRQEGKFQNRIVELEETISGLYEDMAGEDI